MKDLTLHTLLESIANDIMKLEDEGIKATSCVVRVPAIRFISYILM